MWFSLFLAAMLFALTSCETGDDDDATDDDTTDDDTGDDDTGDDDDDTAAGDCVLEGTWQLTAFACGSYDITADWFAIMNSTTLEIAAVADGCSVIQTNVGDTCTEAEEFLYVVGADTIAGESYGITSCDPAACTFMAEDEPCELGDRAGGGGTSSYTLVGDELNIMVIDEEGLCGPLEVIQTYTKQ